MTSGLREDCADCVTGGSPLRVGRSETLGDLLAGFVGILGVSATRLVDLLLTWQARARERQHLRTMDARQLRDLGLTRTDVVVETDKPFWQG